MEGLQFSGYLRMREHPFGDDTAEFARWWLPEVDATGRILRLPRMSASEKDRYTVYETKNILTTAGRTVLLNFIASSTSTNGPFGKIFSVGTFPLASVGPGDTSVVLELARVAPGTATVTGTQVDIPSSFSTTAAVGLWTNVGLYGTTSATTTLGTGTLYTHALFNYNKVNGVAVVVDYLISLT